MDTLEGKRTVVTGAASRIGTAIAAAFIEAGAGVLLCDVNYRAVEVLARQLGDRAIGRFTDVTDERQVAAAIAAARETFGSLDIVVNCAGFGAVAYCAAKAGVDMITRTLAIEWGPEGVRVNSIVPGPIDDTEGIRRLAASPEVKEAMRNSIPLRRLGTKDDIAELALFLASESSAYISGTVMICDGGQSLLGSGPWVEGLKLGARKA